MMTRSAGRWNRAIGNTLEYYERKGVITGKRDTLLRQFNLRFDGVPESIHAKITAIDSEAELDDLLDLIITADSIEGMGL